MKFVTDFLENIKGLLRRRRCYHSIEDLPVLIWFKIHETNDLTLLYKGFKTGFINLDRVWADIYNEYIKRIGLNKEYIAYLDTLKKIGIMECDCVIAPTPIKRVTLAIEREKLNEKTTLKGGSYNEIIAQVSKQQGFPVWKCSVFEFYSYIKINGK